MSEVNSVFRYDEDFKITKDIQEAFSVNGYIVVRGLLDEEETGILKSALEHDDGVMNNTYCSGDSEGGTTKVALWNHPGNDVTGIIARSRKVAETFGQLLGGELYHYHSKVIMKEPRTGGAHLWHQDYGYWYFNGCMYPNMGTAWIAVDKATKENGCVKILKGSHHLGRLDHHENGVQMEADLDRVLHAQKVCELQHMEAEPGDCVFFHSNILHRSDRNNSDQRRWAFLIAYNRVDNNPYKEHHHPQYTPLNMVENSAIKECTTFTDMTGKDFQGTKGHFSLGESTLKTRENE